jgi:hypothetical protein
MEGMKWAAGLFAAAAMGCHAQEARWYAQVANDVAFGTDRWYTSGVRIAREKDGVEWGLVQDIYTPNARHFEPGNDDRAPVARLLVSGMLHDRGIEAWQTMGIELGVRGPPALGHQTTTFIHRIVPAPHVDWSRQLDARLDASAVFTRTQRIAWDGLKVHFGATLGTQVTFAHAGVEFRVGDQTMASAPLRFAPTPPFSLGRDHPAWSAYIGVSERVMGRDELIGRNYDPFRADLAYRRELSRFAVGAAWLPRWGTLALDLVQDAKEFDAQTSPQRYGQLTVHVTF